MQYLDGFAGVPIKDFVRIPNEWNDSHTRPLGNFLRTVWPFTNANDHRSQARLECFMDDWVVGGDKGKNSVEIFERLVRIDHLHAGRCFRKTPAT
jgi:hypothetical protein